MGAALVSEEIRTRIRELWEAGDSSGIIAQKTGRTRNSCIGLIKRMKLPQRESDKPINRKPVYSAPKRIAKPKAVKGVEEGQKKAPKTIFDTPLGHEPFRFESGELVTIETVTDRTCRFPVGTPGTAEFHFCGLAPKAGSIYCPECHRVCRQPVQVRPR